MVEYWAKNLGRAARDVFQLFGGWKIMLGAAIFFVTFYWRCRKHAKGKAEEYWKAGIESAGITAVVAAAIFILYALFISPALIYHEQNAVNAALQSDIQQLQAEMNALQKQLNTRPTPVKTKLLKLSALLTEQADAWDKAKVDAKKSGANAYTLNTLDQSYWSKVTDEFGKEIHLAREELLEHGLRSELLNQLASDKTLQFSYNDWRTSSQLRQIAAEIKRLAEPLNE